MFANTDVITFFAFFLLFLQLVWWVLLFVPSKLPKPSTTWVLYASQTGHAQHLAEQTALQLSRRGELWSAISLSDWLQHYELKDLDKKTILFIVSTQGEGDPPDNAIAFFSQLNTHQEKFSNLSFAILGLGDSRYKNFCGFAHKLNDQLKERRAKSLFDMVLVDNLSSLDIKHWQQQLDRQFATSMSLPNNLVSKAVSATLVGCYQENSNSPSAAMFSLVLKLENNVSWRAGDTIDIEVPLSVPTSEKVVRSYTIANIPNEERKLHLLIRQLIKDDGSLGLGSGYLTNSLSLGDAISLSIKSNPNFHLPSVAAPIIFVAAGSGLAGILALLNQARHDWGNRVQHYLVYGERYREFDKPCREEIEQFEKTGLLKKIDYCFSREEGGCNYVQDVITCQADEINSLIKKGAMVYVCGSKETLGKSVPETLEGCLGKKTYRDFLARKGLRLDVY